MTDLELLAKNVRTQGEEIDRLGADVEAIVNELVNMAAGQGRLAGQLERTVIVLENTARTLLSLSQQNLETKIRLAGLKSTAADLDSLTQRVEILEGFQRPIG